MSTRSRRPQSMLFVAAILATLFFSSWVEAACWCRRDGEIIDCSTRETACPKSSSVDGGAQLCCVTGDTCGEDSLCHFTKDVANTSGYYLGGCTDQSYTDPVCQGVCSEYYFNLFFAPRLRAELRSCGGVLTYRQWLMRLLEDGPTTDVVYNTKSDSWSCCAYPNNTVSCENPRIDQTFKAISPA